MADKEAAIDTVIDFTSIDNQQIATMFREKQAQLSSGFALDYSISLLNDSYYHIAHFDDGQELMTFQLVTDEHLAHKNYLYLGINVQYGYNQELLISFTPQGFLSGFRIQTESDETKLAITYNHKTLPKNQSCFSVQGSENGLQYWSDPNKIEYEIYSQDGVLLSLQKASRQNFLLHGNKWGNLGLQLKLPSAGTVSNWAYALSQNWGGFSQENVAQMTSINRELMNMIVPQAT